MDGLIFRSFDLPQATAVTRVGRERSGQGTVVKAIGMSLLVHCLLLSPAGAEVSESGEASGRAGVCASGPDFGIHDPDADPEDAGFIYLADFASDGRRGRALVVRMADQDAPLRRSPGGRAGSAGQARGSDGSPGTGKRIYEGDLITREWVVRAESQDGAWQQLTLYLDATKKPAFQFSGEGHGTTRKQIVRPAFVEPFDGSDGAVPTLQQMLEAVGESGESPRVELTCEWRGVFDPGKRTRLLRAIDVGPPRGCDLRLLDCPVR